MGSKTTTALGSSLLAGLLSIACDLCVSCGTAPQGPSGSPAVADAPTQWRSNIYDRPAHGENFGRDTQFLSDLDGDGVAEFAIDDDECTWILSGRTRALLARLPVLFGIVDMGDLDHDGTHDLAFIERSARDEPEKEHHPRDPSAPLSSGVSRKWGKHAHVRIVSGRTFFILRQLDVEDGSWSPMHSGGDFDHDGVHDLVFLLTDPKRSDFWPRGLEIRSGSSGERIALLPVRADVPVQPREDRFDWILHVVDDVDGDVVPDMIVVSRPISYFRTSSVRCMSGASGTTIWERELGRDEISVGERILDAGDWNGDGYPDVILNAPAFDGPDWNNQRPVRVLSTRDGKEIDRFVSRESQAVATQRAFAVDIALVRGARTDGRPELWCGSVSTNFLMSTGMLEVIGPDHRIESVPVPDDVPFGTRLASGADVTGDGVDDVLVSGFEWFGGIAGSVLLIDGKTRQILQRFAPDELDRQWKARTK
jgi:hypothetical protein